MNSVIMCHTVKLICVYINSCVLRLSWIFAQFKFHESWGIHCMNTSIQLLQVMQHTWKYEIFYGWLAGYAYDVIIVTLFANSLWSVKSQICWCQHHMLLSHVPCLDHDQLILISAPGHKAIHIGADRDQRAVRLALIVTGVVWLALIVISGMVQYQIGISW